MIEIDERGSYFEIDTKGYLVNPASLDKIQPHWRPVLDTIIAEYQRAYGTVLVNVYLRGSVAKGEAIAGVSDIDTFASVSLHADEIENSWRSSFQKRVRQQFPFVNGIDMTIAPHAELMHDQILLIQSVCVWGHPFPEPKLRPGMHMARHAKGVNNRRAQYAAWARDQHHPPAEVQDECEWVMKGLVRLGFELTMERSKRYTRDLYRCYETFSEYYPEHEPPMRTVLHLALNPTADRAKLDGVVTGFGEWLYCEAERVFA